MRGLLAILLAFALPVLAQYGPIYNSISVVSTAKLGSGVVTTPKLASDAVTAAKIITGAVTTSKLGDGSVTTSKLGADLAMPGAVSIDGTTFQVDSANNRIGIGTASPLLPLDVNGAGVVRGNLNVAGGTLTVRLNGDASGTSSHVDLIGNSDNSDGGGEGAIQHFSPDGTRRGWIGYLDLPGNLGGDTLNIQNRWGDVTIAAHASGYDNHRLTVKAGGDIGIGLTSPCSTCTLHINGELSVVDLVAISTLTGTYVGGSANVCITDNGRLFASEAACP